jgi:hypothetical protein
MAQTQEHTGLTAREIVQNFKNLYSAGRQSDDVRISDRQWLFNLDHHRAQLLRQQAEKGQSPNEANIQALGAWDEAANQPLLAVEKHACGRWYTKQPLPAAVELYRQNLLTFVGTAGGAAFQKTTAQKAEWEQYAKYTKRAPKWYQLGNTLYLVTPPSPSLNLIAVRGVFENPRAVLAFNGVALDPLDYLNFPYPISRTALDTLYTMLTQRELKLATALPYDYQNDGQEGHSGAPQEGGRRA